MKSGQYQKVTTGTEYGNSSRLVISNPSARIVLVIMLLVSLNAVACYDWILSGILRLIRWARGLAVGILSSLMSLARRIYGSLRMRFH